MADNTTVSSSTRERALRIACALISNPNVIEEASVEYQAGQALAVLNAVEKKLGLRPTTPRPGLRDE